MGALFCFSSHTFDIQHHAGESKAGDEASHLGCPRLDRLPGLCPQNHLRSRLYVAHNLKAHGWGQLQHTHTVHDQTNPALTWSDDLKNSRSYNPFSTHYLVLDEAVLIEPDVTHVLHFWGHHHSPRFHLLHSALDGQEVTSLFVLDVEKVALLQEEKKKIANMIVVIRSRISQSLAETLHSSIFLDIRRKTQD